MTSTDNTAKGIERLIILVKREFFRFVLVILGLLVLVALPIIYKTTETAVVVFLAILVALVPIVYLSAYFLMGRRLEQIFSLTSESDILTLPVVRPTEPTGVGTRLRPLHELMKEAKESLIISGHTLDRFTRPHEGYLMTAALQELFGRQVKVQLVFLHPESAYAEAHERFHKYETKGPVSPRQQIKETIKFFEQPANQSECLSVYLSEYMPRFRIIVVDRKLCYVSMYMFGIDVDYTPCLTYREEDPEFAVLLKSVDALLGSAHVTALFLQRRWNHDWENRGAAHVLGSCLDRCHCPNKCERWKLVRHAILGNLNPAFYEGHMGNPITPANYRAGTFTLGQIEQSKFFLEKEVFLEKIVQDFVEFEWPILESDPFIGKQLGGLDKTTVIDGILRTLRFAPKDYKALEDEVYFQEYSDIFRRILLMLVVNDPDREVNENPRLTTNARRFALEILRQIERRAPRIEDWLEYSVIGGILGINTKPDHAATSEVLKDTGILIPSALLDGKTDHMQSAAEDVVRQMDEKRKLLRVVDDTKEYFDLLKMARQRGQVHVVCFTDDYIETILLLRYYLELVAAHPHLKVTLIPRSIRCGNDATARDIPDLKEAVIRESGQERLATVADRIAVAERGPKIGGVHLEKLHPDVIELVRNATFLDVRGARNYEMMQGVKKVTFFSFMVARSTSQILTGLKADATPFFFKKQESGVCSFKEIKS